MEEKWKTPWLEVRDYRGVWDWNLEPKVLVCLGAWHDHFKCVCVCVFISPERLYFGLSTYAFYCNPFQITPYVTWTTKAGRREFGMHSTVKIFDQTNHSIDTTPFMKISNELHTKVLYYSFQLVPAGAVYFFLTRKRKTRVWFYE